MSLLNMAPRRALALAARIARSAHLHGGPYKAVLCSTFRCDCRCAFCGIWRREAAELPASVLVDALAQLPRLAWVDLTGGELFLRPDYLELCEGLAHRLPTLALFHFPTAGQHGDAAVALARSMRDRGIRTVVTVSVDGPAALHDRLRGLPGAWDAAVETFLRLRAEPRVDVYLGTTLIPANVAIYPQEVVAAVRVRCPEVAPHEFHVNVMQRSEHYFDNDIQELPEATEVRAALVRTRRFRGLPRSPFALLEWAFQKLAEKAAAGSTTPLCQALNASFYLAPDGIVQPCHIWDRPLGKIGPDQPNLVECLNSEAARNAREAIDERRCRVCWTPCEAYPTLLSTAANPGLAFTRKPY